MWSAPVQVGSGTTIAGPCPSDITWRNVVPGTPCVFQYDQYQALPTLCDDCSDVSPVAPSGPVSGAPTGCCDTCCSWTFETVFDCATGTWGSLIIIDGPTPVTPPCPPDSDWVVSGDCTREKTVYVPTCDPTPPPDPALPTDYPEDCCPGDCCYTKWVWEYDCDTATWACVGPLLQLPNVPCAVSGPWVAGDPNFCAASYESYTQPPDCSTAVDCSDSPGPPDVLPDPACCANPCVDCAGTQPSMVMSGWTGACVGFNTSYVYVGFVEDANTCTWSWGNDPCGFGEITITYDKTTGIFSAPDQFSISVSCVGGVITGTASVFSFCCDQPSVTWTFG